MFDRLESQGLLGGGQHLFGVGLGGSVLRIEGLRRHGGAGEPAAGHQGGVGFGDDRHQFQRSVGTQHLKASDGRLQRQFGTIETDQRR